MWKTVSEGGTNRLIFLNAQTWWGAIKWIMKGNTQNCNKMQKNIVWKHLQAYVKSKCLVAGLFDFEGFVGCSSHGFRRVCFTNEAISTKSD